MSDPVSTFSRGAAGPAAEPVPWPAWTLTATMTRRSTHHRLLGTSTAWHWFVNMGPQGSGFTWHNVMGCYSGIRLLRQDVQQRAEEDPEFPEKVRQVALEALTMESADLIRRAIQVLTVVGTEADLDLVGSLVDHPDDAIRKDARAAMFERGLIGRRGWPS